jgi:hypothetical protein
MTARSLLCAAVVGALLAGALGAAYADDDEGTLKISATALSAGAGYSWGEGKLSYKGKEYPVTIDGLTVGAVGISLIEATGEVDDLKKLEDFDGTYFAAAAGSTIGGGAGMVTMKNQNGVLVTLRATTRGVGLTLGVSGVKLALKK